MLADCEGTPDILLLASGSEVAPTLQARALLAEEGLRVRVISVPCMEWFEAQDEDYRESVLPCAVRTAGLATVAASFRSSTSASQRKAVVFSKSTALPLKISQQRLARVLLQLTEGMAY